MRATSAPPFLDRTAAGQAVADLASAGYECRTLSFRGRPWEGYTGPVDEQLGRGNEVYVRDAQPGSNEFRLLADEVALLRRAVKGEVAGDQARYLDLARFGTATLVGMSTLSGPLSPCMALVLHERRDTAYQAYANIELGSQGSLFT